MEIQPLARTPCLGTLLLAKLHHDRLNGASASQAGAFLDPYSCFAPVNMKTVMEALQAAGQGGNPPPHPQSNLCFNFGQASICIPAVLFSGWLCRGVGQAFDLDDKRKFGRVNVLSGLALPAARAFLLLPIFLPPIFL